MMRRVRGDATLVPGKAIPLPPRWKFVTDTSQLQIAIPSSALSRFKLIYGFVGSISEPKDMDETTTPLLAQIVVKLAFKYGDTAEEKQDSHVYVRINAFSSKACLDRSFDTLVLGQPVCGIIEATDSDYRSAQLMGWRPTTFQEWYHGQARSYWMDGIELCPESIFYLPQLSSKNITKLHSPIYRLIAQPDPLKLVAARAFALPRGRQDNLLPADPPPFPDHNSSENTVFNELIHGTTNKAIKTYPFLSPYLTYKL